MATGDDFANYSTYLCSFKVIIVLTRSAFSTRFSKVYNSFSRIYLAQKSRFKIEAAFTCLLNYLFNASCNSRLRCNCAKKLSAIGLNLANSSRGRGSDLGSLTVLGLR